MSPDQLSAPTAPQTFEALRVEVNLLKALLEVNIEVAARLDRLVKAVKLDQAKYLGDVDLCLEVAKGSSTKERSTTSPTAPTYHDLVENIIVKTMTFAATQPDSAAEAATFLRLLQAELDELLKQIVPDRTKFRSQLAFLRVLHQFHVELAPGVREFSEIPVGDLWGARAYLDAHPEALTSEAQAALVARAYEAELLGDSVSVARIAQALSVAAPYASDKMEQLLADTTTTGEAGSSAREHYQVEYNFFMDHLKSRCEKLKQEAAAGGGAAP
ncbi:hypothetical protein D0Z00_004175 [Geotrichum galactomycetum]|uniref:Uncharacterized protein n=1 Tax=Geotrichum galactomycetum TaxID=27317 RepID=A0ACB6UZ27_9ASCO|nr:hypothetical protein D0Z00_004175 [Geotrichum candidum]